MNELKIQVPSSFVKRKLKLKGETGAGEGKLFIGSINKEGELDDFFNHYSDNNEYYFTKSNLEDYLKYMQIEYFSEKCNEYQGVNEELYNEKVKLVSKQDERINFTLTKFVDTARYYIRTTKESKTVFDDLFREIALPKITNLIIKKTNSKFEFLLELNYDEINKRDVLSEGQLNSFIDESNRLSVGKNVLLYGVPGSGKSWTIQNEYCNDDDLMERLVFHPDYTYSDFVGQILPNVSEEGMVSYNFTPGPFTKLMKKAYTNPDKEYYLVIEEINRGNAPAIFGEIFQLLDRKTEVKEKGDDGYTIMTSEYGISNSDIAKEVYGDSERKVRIPSNMSIIGTMNTSDQNVFTLDTAFQRRWSMRLIENKFKDDDSELANQKILDTSVTWQMFCESINNIILEKNVRMTSSEDKRLGTHFVFKNDLIFDLREDDSTDEKEKIEARLNNRKFPEKVIKYLWDDAFKFSREEIFDVSRYNSLELIIEKFTNSKANKRYAIFKENIYSLLVPNDNEGIDE